MEINSVYIVANLIIEKMKLLNKSCITVDELCECISFINKESVIDNLDFEFTSLDRCLSFVKIHYNCTLRYNPRTNTISTFETVETLEDIFSKKIPSDTWSYIAKKVGMYITTTNIPIRRWLVERPDDSVIVTILRNVSDDTYSFVNLTHCHICSCRFSSVEEALHDIDKRIEEGSVVRYLEI